LHQFLFKYLAELGYKSHQIPNYRRILKIAQFAEHLLPIFTKTEAA